jgi:hypothetical protein
MTFDMELHGFSPAHKSYGFFSADAADIFDHIIASVGVTTVEDKSVVVRREYHVEITPRSVGSVMVYNGYSDNLPAYVGAFAEYTLMRLYDSIGGWQCVQR